MSNPLFDLTGHVAIVTGTSRGLGQYFARALATAGAAVPGGEDSPYLFAGTLVVRERSLEEPDWGGAGSRTITAASFTVSAFSAAFATA